MVPLLRVSRQGCVTPLLEDLLLMISAVRRNCLICSLLNAVSSAPWAASGIVRQARTPKRSFAKGRGKHGMEVSSGNCPLLYSQAAQGDNNNRCDTRGSHRF